jgi:dTDP-4-amino-4,6-dideoxygalactose transaminase
MRADHRDTETGTFETETPVPSAEAAAAVSDVVRSPDGNGPSLTVDLREGTAPALTVVPTRVPFVDLAAESDAIRPQIEKAMAEVLDRGDFVLGEAVHAFEEEFAAYCGVGHAVGVDSGFSALELILRAHGIGPGDEVITAANTFVATALAIDTCGAKPVLVDIDPTTYNMAPDQIEAAITEATRAIIPVHLYGHPAEMDDIVSIAREHDLWVFEDACQAHGARYRGRRTGSLGDAAAFSFYPSKNLGAFGDGGIVVTQDSLVAELLRLLRNLGSSVKYRHDIKGYNHRLDTLQAAILREKLHLLDAGNQSRRRTAGLYQDLLAGLPLTLPETTEASEHVYHLYVIQVSERARLQEHLHERGVSTGIHYPVPIHLQPAFRGLGYERGSFPVTEQIAGRILSLPMYPHMPLEAIAHVAESVRCFFPDGAKWN